MKKGFVIFLVLVIMFSIVSCTKENQVDTPIEPSDGEVVYEKGPLIVGSWGGTLDPVIENIIAPKFKELTGADLILDPSYSSSKMIAEGEGNISVDVAIMGDSEVADLNNYDLIEEIDFSRIEMDKDFYEKAHDATGKGVYYNWGRYGLVYRTDLCKEVPTKWEDLWNPLYAGHVAINHPKSTAGLQLLTMAADLNGGSQYEIDPGFKKLTSLAQNNLFTVVESTAMMAELLTSGDVWLAGWWDGRAYSLENNNIPVKFVIPEEGVFATINEYVISKETKNINLAYAFLNISLDPENMLPACTATGYGPCDKITAGMLSEEQKAKMIHTEAQVDELIILDWVKVMPNKSVWMDRFDKDVVSKVQKN